MSTCQASFPSYVNKALFKNTKSSLALKFVSDWDVADYQSHAEDDTCMLYFPPDIELLYDDAIEATLARAMQSWSFFTLMPSKMAKLATEMSHFCALKAPLNYERRILLHHHLAWVFLMDEVVERLPLHGLHDTAGKQFIEALKGVMVGEAVADLAEFKGSCPDELLRVAVLSQRILAEDLMPLKRRLLPAHHVRACTQALAQFFDFQYEEGKKFCDEHPSSEILQTRVVTVGGLVPMLLAMEPEQANLHTVEDAGLAQLSLLMTYMNDIIGLYKDLEAVERRDDGSAHLNLVRVGMRELGVNDRAAIHLHARRLNQLTRSFEMFLVACSPARQGFYAEPFRQVFNYLDYHLTGIMGEPNSWYGWSTLPDCSPPEETRSERVTGTEMETGKGVFGYPRSLTSRLINRFLEIGIGRASHK